MNNLKRAFILQFLILFIIPIVSADLSVTIPDKDVYNLGEKIVPIVSIKESSDYDGFFNLNIDCGDYNLKYYTIPLSLEADFRTQLTVPDLSLSKSMVGICELKSSFEASGGERVDSAVSENFEVTDELLVEVNEDLDAKPGDNIVISGEVRKDDNELLKKGEVEIRFKNKKYNINLTSGEFEYVISLDDDAETGVVPVRVSVTDKYGNNGDKTLNVNIKSIPTRITNIFESDILMPNDNLKVQVNLYDHRSKVMGGDVNVKAFDTNDELIANKEIKSSAYFEFTLEKEQIPGSYFLLSTFEDVKQRDDFIVGVLRKITMEQKDNFVHVENVGNVEYDDKITVVLESEEKNYLINEKIKLKPGEKIVIDLSKEVPQGTYDIVLPAVEDDVTEKNVIEDVAIDDNRNVVKKAVWGVSAITGAIAGVAGYVASRPTLAAIILVLIIFGTVTHYSWGFIKNKVKGKEEETEHIFEDYKFDSNEDNKPGN
jgi:hypothetical protein